MLGVVASLLTVVCKRCKNSQQCWDLQCIVGRIHPIRLWRPCVMRVRGSNNVGRAVQTDPTLLCNASAITEQKKCCNWELLAHKFDRFQTAQQLPKSAEFETGQTFSHVQTDATTPNTVKPTMLGVVASVGTQLHVWKRIKHCVSVFKNKSSLKKMFEIVFRSI